MGLKGLSALVVLAATLTVTTLVVATPVAEASTCSAPHGQKVVAVVVAMDASGEPSMHCIQFDGRLSGIDALRRSGHQIRVEGGFVCAIDGLPASGCATGSGFDGAYWRYFRGSRAEGWKYSTIGSGYPVSDAGGCAFEGWVYSGDTTISPPSLAPGAIGCSVASAPPTAAGSVPPVTTGPPPPAGGGGTSNPSASPPPAEGGASVVGPGQPGGDPTATVSGGTDTDVSGSRSGEPVVDGAGEAGTAETNDDRVQADRDSTGDTRIAGDQKVADDEGRGSRRKEPIGSVERASGPGRDVSDDSGSPTGLIIGVGILAVVVAAALVVRRQREGLETSGNGP